MWAFLIYSVHSLFFMQWSPGIGRVNSSTKKEIEKILGFFVRFELLMTRNPVVFKEENKGYGVISKLSCQEHSLYSLLLTGFHVLFEYFQKNAFLKRVKSLKTVGQIDGLSKKWEKKILLQRLKLRIADILVYFL